MITRKVDADDALAGFTYNWVKKFGENVGELKVICLEKGNVEGLPANVEVFSLGKESGAGKLKKLWNFHKLAKQIVPQVDGVFCHMNPIYTIVVAPYSKYYHKKIVSWYTHKAVTWELRLVNLLADKIVTASEKSFRLKSKKVEAIGHGIDTDVFRPHEEINKIPLNPPFPKGEKEESSPFGKGGQGGFYNDKFRIISVGRISPVKDYDTLIEAINILVNEKGIKDIEVEIAGDAPLESQKNYFQALKDRVRDYNLQGVVKFVGWISNKLIPDFYRSGDLFINLSGTGSVDKAVLEAMSCGLLVLTSNEAYGTILEAKYLVSAAEPLQLAEKILTLKNSGGDRKLLRQIVVENHNLNNLIGKVLNKF